MQTVLPEDRVSKKYSKSAFMAKEIARLIPGGVDSPFRSFQEVGGPEVFFKKALGSRLFDIDGNEYIDYLGAWGPAILGHCPATVVSAICETVAAGPVFGSPHELEYELASLLTKAVPSLDMVRFVNSGTEAVMSAIRLCRGASGKDLVLMFEGCYHGHSDSVLASQQHSSSTGIPSAFSQKTLLVPYNDLPALEACLKAYGKDIACIVIEPVACSMGVIPPEPGYLLGVEALSKKYNVLLIFDEVLTGLRLALDGAQGLYGITPDLSCYGKALGGGMPIGAYGGKRELMEHLQPLGKVYQAGTFSGNPVTMAAGISTLKLLKSTDAYEVLEARTNQLFTGLKEIIDSHDYPLQLQRTGSLFAILCADKPVKNFHDSLKIDSHKFACIFRELLDGGVYFPPSAVDAACVSAAHTSQDIEQTINVCSNAFARVFCS
jgi:glutamate-1-semialdehyde 2,1-aminomutase